VFYRIPALTVYKGVRDPLEAPSRTIGTYRTRQWFVAQIQEAGGEYEPINPERGWQSEVRGLQEDARS
jgi:hypothetical protein